MKKLLINLTIFSALLASNAYANNEKIIDTMTDLGFPADNLKISDSPLKNFKSVLTNEGIYYVSDDGNFITQGPIYDMRNGSAENINNATNLQLIHTIEKNAIVYQAKNEKYIIHVFTDYTCTYCKMLHEHIDDYLNEGISVHYYAFPRSGMNSQVAKDMQSIWSMKDRKTAFDNAYKGSKIAPATSMVPYVQMQYTVGRQLGLTGTPAIILPDGQLLGGYVPAKDLITLLEKKSAN